MKVEIQAGAMVDLLSPKEASDMIREQMRGWHAELARNVRWRRAGDLQPASGTGVLALSVGPAEGFIWEVTRITITGLTAAETVTAYVNDASGMLAVAPFTATASVAYVGQRGCVLDGGDKLIVSGIGLTAAKQYGVAIQATELPVQLGWRLV